VNKTAESAAQFAKYILLMLIDVQLQLPAAQEQT